MGTCSLHPASSGIRQREQVPADRYVEGACYICGWSARSDQCDNCGNVLEPEGCSIPRHDRRRHIELRDTEHYYLDLSSSNRK
jgi:methionyl-tRNA synthetase